MLPEDQRTYLRRLWDEFEAQSTPEARFANSLDRVQPLLLNYCKHGETWVQNGIRREQVEARNQPTYDGSKVLGDLAMELIRRAAEEGLLK